MERKDILRLALEAEVDPRTAERAIALGVEAIKGKFTRERLQAAAKRLGLKLKVGKP